MKTKEEPVCCPTCGKSTTLYAWRDMPAQKESAAYRKRIRNLIAEFELGGYETYQRDVDAAVAASMLMVAQGSKPHLEKLLSHHMERITAASFLQNQGALS